MKRLLLVLAILTALGATGVGAFLAGKGEFSRSPATTVYSLAHLQRKPPFLVHQPVEDRPDFEDYRRMQIALVKSRLVLNGALRNPKVAQLPLVQELADPVTWLEKNLVVDSPDDPCILRIALKGDDATALVAIVEAVTDAYVKDSTYKEHNQRLARLKKLNGLFAELHHSVNEKRRMLQMMGRQTEPEKIGAEARVQYAAELGKELPRVHLAQAAAQARLKKAEGKDAEGLNQELTALEAQEQVILRENEKVKAQAKNLVDLRWLEEEILDAESALRSLRTAIAELTIELQAPPRVTLLQEAVTIKADK